MKTRSIILCVFEGEKREPKYFKNIEKYYFNTNSILFCCYGNDIYELFKELRDDPDLDIVEILRESKNITSNRKILENYSRDDFNQVFLFFDLEYQDEQFDVLKLNEMLQTFDEETENGKLFVSYPMIEAIRDVPSIAGYIDHKVNLENCTGKRYKRLSAQGLKRFQDPRKITKEQWNELIRINVCKANFMISNARNDLISQPQQDAILLKQSKIMQEDKCIYVLSSFPLFVFHQKASQLLLE